MDPNLFLWNMHYIVYLTILAKIYCQNDTVKLKATHKYMVNYIHIHLSAL